MKFTDSKLLAFLSLLLALVPGTDLRAQNESRIANIEKAAAEIAPVHREKGADGALVVINDCYKRELALAKSLTPGLEACMTQDIIVSKLTALAYGSVSENARKMAGAPEPSVVLNAMMQRVVGTMRRFKVSDDDAARFSQLVQTRGMEMYGKTRFPNDFPAKKN